MPAAGTAPREMSAGTLVNGVSIVAVDGRALMIEGEPGSGKSTLALALIDRGAVLVGDDGARLEALDRKLIAMPPPNIAGKLEIRGVGIVDLPTTEAPVALILSLSDDPDRLPTDLAHRAIMGCDIPVLPFQTGDPLQALRAEWALRIHGLAMGASR